jgi:hypothetical protein
MENSKFRRFAANGKQKRQTYVCLLQTETENRRLFAADGNGKQMFAFFGPQTNTISGNRRYNFLSRPYQATEPTGDVAAAAMAGLVDFEAMAAEEKRFPRNAVFPRRNFSNHFFKKSR